jgi:hypothetical protein
MKTPMQEMLEWVRATLPMDLDWPQMIEHKIESLLKKEKEMIENVYVVGYSDGDNDFYFNDDYYNETFNTK